jgi:RNA polymerase sigma factor for flagellar operon FliA
VDAPDEVAQHRALVERIANEVVSEFGARSERDDLVQTGFEGLLHAKSRFDANGVVPFPAFAYRRIRGAMIDMLRKSQSVPRSVRERCSRAAKLEQTLEQETHDAYERPPTGELDATAAISAAFGKVTASYVADLTASVERHGTEEGLVTQLDVGKVRHAIQKLPDFERSVVHAFFFEEQRLTDIGAAAGGKSESWACRALGRSLDLLREMLS